MSTATKRLTTQSNQPRRRSTANTITTCLWCDDDAEQMAKFYVSVFKGGKVLNVSHYTEGTRGKPGSVMTVEFEIMGRRFTALNGGPLFQFNESVSFIVHCENQREIDYYWKKLTAGGGKPVQCGWLKDKFGVSWQITPDALFDLARSKDREQVARVMGAMMKMVKFDIKKLQEAAITPAKKRQP